MHTTIIQGGLQITASLAVLIAALAFILGSMVYAIAHRRQVDISTGPGRVVIAVSMTLAIVGVAWSFANLTL